MNCHRLPSLPGLSLNERLRKNHHVSHCFSYINGYRIDRKPSVSIGKEPIQEDYKELHSEPIDYDPQLIYGRVKTQQVEPFRPHYVIYDKKTLKFSGYFRQHVPESRTEHYRTRYVNIFYYLEDDTLEVIEPVLKNCGLFPQGRLLRRGKIAKNASVGIFYTWKDLNIGVDIELGGIVYHVADCDAFTREFLTANGIEVNQRECMPKDPYAIDKIIQEGRHKQQCKRAPKNDKLRRFLEFSGIVLCFDCVLDETDRPGGEYISFKMYYYLEDDTVVITVKELPENQQGRDRFPLLLKRTKLPKNWQKKPHDFASIIFDTSDAEIEEFYCLSDFMIGMTIFVFGRKFLILDCDKFTREYFDRVLRCPQPNRLEIEKKKQPEIKIKLPDYLGLGTPEDSLASCYYLIPKSPKKDAITYLMNANKVLKYGCKLDTAHPEEKDRKFIMTYNLADGKITIIELSVPNSGITGGKFLSARKIVKPQSNPNKPEYYEPRDFVIGETLLIFSHRFVITSADLYVYRYMQAHPELFSMQSIESVRLYNLREGHLRDDLRVAMAEEQRRHEELQQQKNVMSKEDSVEERAERATVQPYIGEEEVKKFYHDQQGVSPSYMEGQKCELPCNINVKEDENIPSDYVNVRFLEPHEESA